jgi:hypothetical protein
MTLKDLFNPQIEVRTAMQEWIFVCGEKLAQVPAYVYIKDKKILSVGVGCSEGERMDIFSNKIDRDTRCQLMEGLFRFGFLKVSSRFAMVRPRVVIKNAMNLHEILEGGEKEILTRLALEAGAQYVLVE